MIDVLRQVVAAAYTSLGEAGIVLGAEGNASVAERSSGIALVTGTGLQAREATAEGIAEVGLDDGVHLSGPEPTSELPSHLALLRAGHGAVIHSHAPHATALGLVLDEVPLVLAEQAACAGGAAPVVPYVTPGSDDMALTLEAVLRGPVRACVIRNHGLVTVGPDIVSALQATLAPRRRPACTYWPAASASRPACPVTRSPRCARSAASPPDHPRERHHVDARRTRPAQQARADVGRRARGVDVVDQHDVTADGADGAELGAGVAPPLVAVEAALRTHAVATQRHGDLELPGARQGSCERRRAVSAAPVGTRPERRHRHQHRERRRRLDDRQHERCGHVGGAAQAAVLPRSHERVGRAGQRHGAARRRESEPPPGALAAGVGVAHRRPAAAGAAWPVEPHQPGIAGRAHGGSGRAAGETPDRGEERSDVHLPSMPSSPPHPSAPNVTIPSQLAPNAAISQGRVA